MKESYISTEFRETVKRRFPDRAQALTDAFHRRLEQLRAENTGESKEKLRHLESQIMPGVAAYETLQSVMPKEEAFKTVHGYVEKKAWRMRRAILKLMRLSGAVSAVLRRG